MLFNSLSFLVFFIVVTSGYFAIPHKYRWFWLLSASCYFYMFFIPVYILILGFTIIIDYFAGLLLEKTIGRKRRIFLICSLIANIGVLAVFKYYNFLNNNLSAVLMDFSITNPIPSLSILLPIGLSFHTFQAMSYTIEVYRGKQKAEHHFGIYALYVMFYPQLVSGPIERPQNLLHQFHEEHFFDYNRITNAIKLIFWGLFQKVVIADRISVVVDSIYNDPHAHHGLSMIIATIFFSFQIYCDFSGYSDIAVGCAQVMGFKLMRNFNRPYFSKSIHELWSRWHISLSTWFRDYLYISLGGNRVKIYRWYLNLFIVFLVSGLWHGANWTFVIWGAIHGFYLIFSLVTKEYRERIRSFMGLDRLPLLQNSIQVFITFMLVTFSWIFFRAKNITDALYIIKNAIIGLPGDLNSLLQNKPLNLDLGLTGSDLAIGVAAILFMEAIHLMQNKVSIIEWLSKKPIAFRWCVYYFVFFLILFFGVFQNRQFIYFQF